MRKNVSEKRKEINGWTEQGWNKGRSGWWQEEKRGGKKREAANTGVLNSFTDSSGNITNPKVVFTSLCAMIPGGIVKA